MIKGVILGISIAVFVISIILIFSGVSGNLGPNLITGHVIGEGDLVGVGFIGLIISLIITIFILIKLSINWF